MTEKPIIAFDCVGTVFDASRIPVGDMRDYVSQVRRPKWGPLELPGSFSMMPPHRDAAEGIRLLREHFRVVTCSNLPADLLCLLSGSSIQWDAIVPLEASRAYKPAWDAYITVCNVMQVLPSEVLVVTAHADGPDVTGAPNAGMNVQIIRNPGCPQTIIELAVTLAAAKSAAEEVAQ